MPEKMKGRIVIKPCYDCGTLIKRKRALCATDEPHPMQVCSACRLKRDKEKQGGHTLYVRARTRRRMFE